MNNSIMFLLSISLLFSRHINASILSDLAIENAEAFKENGVPKAITLDQPLEFFRFSKLSYSPSEDVTLLFKGVYSYFKNNDVYIERIDFVEIDWGDGTFTEHPIDGSPETISHTYNLDLQSGEEAIFKLKILISTTDKRHTEHAKVVITLSPRTVQKSSRLTPHQIVWNGNCLGEIENDLCFVWIWELLQQSPVDMAVILSDGPQGEWHRFNVSDYSGLTYDQFEPVCPGTITNGVCYIPQEIPAEDYVPALEGHAELRSSYYYHLGLNFIVSDWTYTRDCSYVRSYTDDTSYWSAFAPFCRTGFSVAYCVEGSLSERNGQLVCSVEGTEIIYIPYENESYLACDQQSERVVDHNLSNDVLNAYGDKRCVGNIVARDVCFDGFELNGSNCEKLVKSKKDLIESHNPPVGTYNVGGY